MTWQPNGPKRRRRNRRSTTYRKFRIPGEQSQRPRLRLGRRAFHERCHCFHETRAEQRGRARGKLLHIHWKTHMHRRIENKE